MAAYERDLRLGLLGARRLGIPLIIGSCGGGGNDTAVDGYLEMVDRIVTDAGVHRTRRVREDRARSRPARAEVPRRQVAPRCRARPRSTRTILRAPGHIVAMAGAEPIQDALDDGADVVLLGRCADAAIFAAMPLAPRLRSRPGVERSEDRGVRIGDRDEPPWSGLGALHDRGRRLRARAARPAVALHAGERRRAHAVRDRGSLPPDDAVGHARRARGHLRSARRPAGQGARRHVHAGRRLHREARGRGAGRVPLDVLGIDARRR